MHSRLIWLYNSDSRYRKHWENQARDIEEKQLDDLVSGVEGRTLLKANKLKNLVRLLKSVEHIRGDAAELGVYTGGSAKLMAMVAPNRPLHLFDTFEGIPEDDTETQGHHKGEFASALEDVQAYLHGYRVSYHVGIFPQSIPEELNSCKFAFVHLDADTFQSTRAGIEWFWQRMMPGAVMVLDDYGWQRLPRCHASS